MLIFIAEVFYDAVRGLLRKPNTIEKIAELAWVTVGLFFLSRFVAGRVDHVTFAFALRWLWLPLSLVFLVLRYGEGFKRWRFRRFFECSRFICYDGKPPQFLYSIPQGYYLECVRFLSTLPMREWEKMLPNLEEFYKKRIFKISQPGKINFKDVYFITRDLPKLIRWDDSYTPDGRCFAVGEGYVGQVIWDAAEMPHGLVAGSTGSGKTGLLRCIIHQAIQKQFHISVLDFKGGGDFVLLEDVKNSTVISEPEAARDELIYLLAEVRDRMAAFKAAGVSNVDEYNALGREQFEPWLLVVDEAAEVLDVKAKGEEKELYTEIDQTLRTLARLSRAARVHLLMGVIRPSHEVLDGQIKNNLLWRVCGYFPDSPASRIVLDNDKATELPPDVKGRFMVGDEVTQAYYLDTGRRSARRAEQKAGRSAADGG